MKGKTRFSFEMNEVDLERLRAEAKNLGLNNASALVRLLIKQFFHKLDKGGDVPVLTNTV